MLTVGFGGATQRACPGLDGVVYRTIGVHPIESSITGVDLTAGTIGW